MRIIHGDTRIYRGDLPHLQRQGASYFVTARIADSMPRELVESIRIEEKRILAKSNKPNLTAEEEVAIQRQRSLLFARYDDYLDHGMTGPQWMKDPRCADLVCSAILKEDGVNAEIECFTVMSNHIHLLLTPYPNWELYRITKHIKQESSYSVPADHSFRSTVLGVGES